MKKTTRDFFFRAMILALSAIFMRTVAVGYNARLARDVGAEGMGLYTLCMSVWNFAVTLATSGIGLAVTRTVSAALGRGDPGGARKRVWHAVLWALLFGTVAGCLLFICASPIGCGILRDPRTVPALRLLGLATVPLALSTVFVGYFTACQQTNKNAADGVIEQFFRMCAVSMLLRAALPRGTEAACLAIVGGGVIAEIGSCAFLSMQYVLQKRKTSGGFSRKIDFTIIRDIAAIAMPVALSAYVRSGLLSVEHALIPEAICRFGKSRPQALAEYGILQSMALPLVLYPSSVLYAVSGMLIPEYTRRQAANDREGICRLTGKVLSVTSVFSFGSAAVLSAFSRELSRLLYASDDPAEYVFFLAFVLPVMFADHVTDCALKGLGEQVFCMWINILDAAVSILLVCLILPRMGAPGYVIVIILAEILNFSFSFGRLCAVTGYRPALFGVLLRPALSAAATFTLVRLLPADDPTVAGDMVFRSLLLVVGYVFFLLLLSPTKKKRPRSFFRYA